MCFSQSGGVSVVSFSSLVYTKCIENGGKTMTTKNDVTGDRLITKVASNSYRDNWERIFGDKYKDGRAKPRQK